MHDAVHMLLKKKDFRTLFVSYSLQKYRFISRKIEFWFDTILIDATALEISQLTAIISS